MDKEKLNEYKKKRDFNKTTEPKGSAKTNKGDPRFVIQQHDARQMHFDFRLEIDGVLKSWALPKGPSTDPSEKRMAINTEDHPLDYAGFEGTIPEGEYGGGTIIVWDGGTYRNLRKEKERDGMSMQQSFDDGKIEVWLEGKKLKGGYVLIHTKQNNEKQWLFKKMKDGEADARRKPVKTEPKSILSDKTIDEMEDAMDGE